MGRRRKGYAMGNELNAYVYDYYTRGEDGCPLLVLTPVDESRHMFRRGMGGGYAAAAATSTGISGGIG
jgi:hypothetical protein